MLFDRLGGVFSSLDGSTGSLLAFTERQFYLAYIQGWLAAPLILICSLVFSCARVTPILAGGIGVARVVAGAFFVVVSW